MLKAHGSATAAIAMRVHRRDQLWHLGHLDFFRGGRADRAAHDHAQQHQTKSEPPALLQPLLQLEHQCDGSQYRDRHAGHPERIAQARARW
jgi:hypothetical protein